MAGAAQLNWVAVCVVGNTRPINLLDRAVAVKM